MRKHHHLETKKRIRAHPADHGGHAFASLAVEARLTLCNMSIEIGARLGLVAPDAATFAYVRGREMAPAGAAFEQAVAWWRQLRSDPGAAFERDVVLDCTRVAPQVTWGTTPQDVAGIDGHVPDPASFADAARRTLAAAAIAYMGLRPGMPLAEMRPLTQIQFRSNRLSATSN